MASLIETWVNDKLHDILGISDKFISQFLLGLAKKATDPDDFVNKIRETGTVDIDTNILNFAHELWNKVNI